LDFAKISNPTSNPKLFANFPHIKLNSARKLTGRLKMLELGAIRALTKFSRELIEIN
jgi:hypothetical protein